MNINTEIKQTCDYRRTDNPGADAVQSVFLSGNTSRTQARIFKGYHHVRHIQSTNECLVKTTQWRQILMKILEKYITEKLIYLTKFLLSFFYYFFNMSKKSSKFYAVSTGRSTGIFTSWGNAQEQVIGYQGAVYRRYPTLEEALQDMQVNGHYDPPVFNHREVEVVKHQGAQNTKNINLQVRPSQSDSELSIKVSYAPVLPKDTTENEMILEIEHPEFDIQQLFTSNSSTEIVTASSPVLSPDTSPKKLLYSNNVAPTNPDQVNDLDVSRSYPHANENTTSSFTQTDNVYTTNSTSMSALQLSSIEKIQYVCDHLSNKVDHLETKLQQQIDLNKEMLSSFLAFQKEQASIIMEKEKKLNEMKGLLEEIASSNHQAKSACNGEMYDKLLANNSQLLKEVEEVKTCQKSQNSMISHTLESTKASQQMIVQLDKRIDEELSTGKERPTLKKSSSTQPSIHTEEIQRKMSTVTKPSNTQQDNLGMQDKNLSDLVSKFDDNSEDSDILQYHPRLNNHSLNGDIEEKERAAFHLHNKESRNVLIGDSNLKTINR